MLLDDDLSPLVLDIMRCVCRLLLGCFVRGEAFVAMLRCCNVIEALEDDVIGGTKAEEADGNMATAFAARNPMETNDSVLLLQDDGCFSDTLG